MEDQMLEAAAAIVLELIHEEPDDYSEETVALYDAAAGLLTNAFLAEANHIADEYGEDDEELAAELKAEYDSLDDDEDFD